MNPLRVPTVGGLAGGVGTTTVARALHGRELGTVDGDVRLPDVVVCRATVSGLTRAVRPMDRPTPAPVLVVTAEPVEPPEPVTDLVRDLGSGWAGPVVLPYVGQWVVAGDPHTEAAGLLGRSERPAELELYAEALGRIVELLTSGGRLEQSDDELDEIGTLRPVRGIRVGPPAEPGPAWAGVAITTRSAW